MKKVIIATVACLVCCSCKNMFYPEITSSLWHEVNIGSIYMEDGGLKNDTAYYRIITLVCNSDTIFYFVYTDLLAPNQSFKAAFIPTLAFNEYSSLITSKFCISPNILELYNPQDGYQIDTLIESGNHYIGDFAISIRYHTFIENSNHEYTNLVTTYFDDTYKWSVITSNNHPKRIYYHYDWQSSVHYDYMRYNADSAILTFTIENPIEADTITPIDSAYIIFHDSPIAKGYNVFPLQVTDTISVLDDTIFNYRVGALLKNQHCGEDTYSVRVHKSEIISKQNDTNRHQWQIYEYDE